MIAFASRRQKSLAVSGQGLSNECRHDPSIVQTHAGSVSVKNAHDLGIDVVIPVIGHGHCFSETLGLIVNPARADWIHIAPVILLLRMHQWIAIAFRSRSENERGLLVLGQAEGVVSPECADL